MKYLLILFLIAVGYYTFTYGVFIIRKEKNTLAAAGTILLAVIGILAPIIVLFIKY
jgi:hypothetical protein